MKKITEFVGYGKGLLSAALMSVAVLLITTSMVFAAGVPGDMDGDCDVDRNDIRFILADLNTPASGPDDVRDMDGDGMITVRDARKLVLLCTEPRCRVLASTCSNIDFRVNPYQQNPDRDGITITWFTENNTPGTLQVTGGDLSWAKEYTSVPELMEELAYSELEESERSEFPDMFANANYKHSIQINELTAGTTYNYSVSQGDSIVRNTFKTAPEADSLEPIRFIVYADSETEPAGRLDKRDWGNRDIAPAAQAEGSTGRPDNLPKDSRGRELYLSTQFEGFAENIKVAESRDPAFIIMPGDLVQGGGYQRAWDEFFFHNGGKFDDLLSARPILPALGNWENFAARNGGYAPEAVMASREKYKAYFDKPANNNPDYQDQYYRIDYGPVTIITLDSSNGLPQASDADTNVNIDEATYPGNDLADFNPGSDQWLWAMEQLEDAKAKGQVIFVQFHHAPYTSGRHGYPVSSANPRATGQAGVPMRVYSPMFEAYGVVAVFSGHSEFFERSLVNGVHYYDVGIAGDGLRGPEEPLYAAENNPYSQWTAHYNEPELWEGNRLISGGKHYGHLEVNVVPRGDGSFEITMTPVHVFPVIDDNFNIIDWQRRVYSDEVYLNIQRHPRELSLLSEPYLQLPTENSVIVAWFTDFEGSSHTVTYGEELENTVTAVSTKMTRMFEDDRSDIFNSDGTSLYGEFTERGVWRHEAVIVDLEAGERIPYYVSSTADMESAQSGVYSLQANPNPGTPVTIVLTSDQQNRAMSAGTFQKLVETVGIPDAVLFAGDLVDNPHRASEWFDRQNEGRPAFFPSMQGTFRDLFPDHPYTGGAVLQHAPLFGTIGNHESPGRFAKHGAENAGINAVDGDPQPRWYAEYRYNRDLASGAITPPADPVEAAVFREQFIRDWSYEHTAYFEMWNHPDDGPKGESYWAHRFGDVFIISMNVSRVWRHWNPDRRGKFSEAPEHLNNPDEWGFGDMFFEHYGVDSEQYSWLVDVLASEEFLQARYRVVLGHQTMFGLGDNALPVMADPIATITYLDTAGREQTMEKVWPADADTFERDILPLVERQAIVDIYYDYPIENDIWTNDIEPLLIEHGVQLVHTGHSHLWNRTQTGSLHYIETSNYGNSFGVGYRDESVEIARAPWAHFPGEDSGKVGPNPEYYPRFGDPQGREPIYPSIMNPEVIFGESETEVPFVSSNEIGVFTVLSTEDGKVRSYAYDWNDPEGEVILFDEFSLISEGF